MKIFLFYFLFFLTYAFLGWCMEVIVCGVQAKKFVNRGFLIGPYCPIYGNAVLIIYLALGNFTPSPPILFLLVFVFGTILEYITSFFMEKLFHARWWDYSKKKFNINGRVCLSNSVAFGLLGCFVVYITNPIIVPLLESIPTTILYIVGSILFTIFVIDNILSYNVLSKIKSTADKMEKKDNTEELTERIKEILRNSSLLQKRIVSAFPDLRAIIKEKTEQIEKTISETTEKLERTISETTEKLEKTINEKTEKLKENNKFRTNKKKEE